jgi:predicted transcriptional regulator
MNLQEEKAEPRRGNPRIVLAVLLLVTSGLTLPLSTVGVAASSAVPSHMTTSRIIVFAISPANASNGKALLDGVPPAFVVASSAPEGPHQADDFGFSNAPHPPGGPPAVATPDGLNDTVVHAFFHAQKLGFVLGSSGAEQGQGNGFWAQGFPGGATLRAGYAAETMMGPSSASTISSVTAAVPKVWWEFSQRRSKFEIYVEILELMKSGPMTPFEVAFYARLNHKRTKEYAEFLAQAGYLQGVSEDGKLLYVLTKDGVGFLDRVRSLLIGPGIIEVTSTAQGYQRDF